MRFGEMARTSYNIAAGIIGYKGSSNFQSILDNCVPPMNQRGAQPTSSPEAVFQVIRESTKDSFDIYKSILHMAENLPDLLLQLAADPSSSALICTSHLCEGPVSNYSNTGYFNIEIKWRLAV